MTKIRKAIIPVAGLATRFLPATKALPKAMLAVVDKPVIQYIVEEMVEAGIEQIIFVTGSNQHAIEDHFDSNFELEYKLKLKKKMKGLEEVRKATNLASFVFTRQHEPLGDGHAILQAKDLVGDEPVAISFGDDVIDSKTPAIGQLMKVHEKYGGSVAAVYQIPKEDISRYGVISGESVDDRTWKLDGMVEKPKPEDAPSDKAIIGRYIVTREVLDALGVVEPGEGGEIRLIDALEHVRKNGGSVYAHQFEGRRYDCGDKEQFMEATVDYALKHNEVNSDGKFSDYIKNLASKL